MYEDEDDGQTEGQGSSAEFYQALEAEFKGMSLADACRAYAEVRRQIDEAEERLKPLKRRKEWLERTHIPTAFDDQGVTVLKVDGLGRFSLRGDAFVSIKRGMKPKVFEWLDDMGKGDLIKKEVNPSTLKALTKAMIKEGEEIPSDLINYTPFTAVTLTKA